jgi:hypothetical protein
VSIWSRLVACPAGSAAGTAEMAAPAPPCPAKGLIVLI